jgi:hypothetical protein
MKMPWQTYINGTGACNLSEGIIRILQYIRVHVERVSVNDATQTYVFAGYLAKFGGWVMMTSITNLEIHIVWVLLEDLRKGLKLEGHDPTTEAALGHPRVRSAIRCLQIQFWKEYNKLRNDIGGKNSVNIPMSRARVERALIKLSKSRNEPEWDEAKSVCMKCGRKAQAYEGDNPRVNTLTGCTLNAIEQRILSILGSPIEIEHFERTQPVSATLGRTSFSTKSMEQADVISIRFHRFSLLQG